MSKMVPIEAIWAVYAQKKILDTFGNILGC